MFLFLRVVKKRVLFHFFPSHHHVARFTLTKLSIVKFILSAFGVHRTHTESSSVRLESSTSGDVSEGKPLKYFWHWRWSHKDIQCICWLIPHIHDPINTVFELDLHFYLIVVKWSAVSKSGTGGAGTVTTHTTTPGRANGMGTELLTGLVNNSFFTVDFQIFVFKILTSTYHVDKNSHFNPCMRNRP